MSLAKFPHWGYGVNILEQHISEKKYHILANYT